ncbi:MAG: hypothetical protein P0Y51_14570 [Candidatus Pseudomonas colombiensis]|nr:MAG: hypothetical protein P0Y51_14570 [Pseudomonas sp.]
MKPNAELRLFAVPLCGGLVLCVAKGLINGWNATELFSGFLFGFVIATVLGIPLLLWGDRRFGRFKGRHLVSGLIQAWVASLMVHGSSMGLWLMTLLGGLALGALYSLVVSGIERLAIRREPGFQQRWATILAVPVSGGLTLGGVAVLLDPGGSENLSLFCFFALVGALLSLLVSWPVLWLMQRFFSTPWRYVIGRGISGVLIWLLFGAPGAPQDGVALRGELGVWQLLLDHLILPFLLIGLLAGAVFTALDWLCQRRSP